MDYFTSFHICILVVLRKSKICIILAVLSKILEFLQVCISSSASFSFSFFSHYAIWVKLTISLILKQQIASFFMDTINSSHSYATGGTSAGEFWYNF